MARKGAACFFGDKRPCFQRCKDAFSSGTDRSVGEGCHTSEWLTAGARVPMLTTSGKEQTGCCHHPARQQKLESEGSNF
jgi:hypothetical protein